MTRLTAACPEALIADANQLAMCLAFSEADGLTFRTPCGWQDQTGNLYTAASWEASDAWITKAQAPLVRPDWDTDSIIDMDAANAAQASMVLWLGGEDAPPLASTNALTLVAGNDALASLSMIGLTVAPQPVSRL
jgi:hypothetical protein